MADYFAMMRDTVGSFGEGREETRLRRRQIDADARAKLMQGREDEEYAYRTGLRRKEDEAYGSLEALNKGVYDGAQTDFGAPKDANGNAVPFDQSATPIAQGMRGPSQQPAPMPVTAPGGIRKATDREFNQANMGVAVATRNLAQQTALRGEGKKLDIGDTYQETIAKMAKDPAFFDEVMKNTNLESKRLQWDDGLDENGKRTGPRVLSIIQDDGKIKKFTPTGAQQKAVALAMAHIQNGDVDGGLAMLNGVNKDVAEAAARELKTDLDVAGVNTTNQRYYDQRLHEEAVLAETKRDREARARQAADELVAQERYRKDDLRLRGAAQNRPQFLQLVDGKGKAVLVNQSRLKTGPDGVLALPAGYTFPRQRPDIDYRAVEARAAALEGTPKSKLTAGAKGNLDRNESYLVAMEMLYPGQLRQPNSGGEPEVATPKREGAPDPAPATPSPGLQRGSTAVDPFVPRAARAGLAYDPLRSDRTGRW